MSQSVFKGSHRRWRLLPTGILVVSFSLSAWTDAAFAKDGSEELVEPPICSAQTADLHELKEICNVTPLGYCRDGYCPNEVKVNLTAETAAINVDGYRVTTENYNETYLPSVIETVSGDRRTVTKIKR